MRVVPSICSFCGVGCGIGLRVEDGRVVGVEPQPGHPVSQGQLCAKGWASSFAIDAHGRLTQPLIKEHGQFRPASFARPAGTRPWSGSPKACAMPWRSAAPAGWG